MGATAGGGLAQFFSQACARRGFGIGWVRQGRGSRHVSDSTGRSRKADKTATRTKARLVEGHAGAAGPVRLRTIVLIRWVAVGGQAVTLLIVHYALGFTVQLLPAFAVVGASVLLNLAVTLFPPLGGRLDDHQATLFLVYDTLQLAMLLFLTGGLENPFSLLMLGPVTISATILSQRSTIALSLLAVLLVSLLAFWHLPLPWDGPSPVAPTTLVVGNWVALVLSILVIVGNTLTVTAEARRMSDAL